MSESKRISIRSSAQLVSETKVEIDAFYYTFDEDASFLHCIFDDETTNTINKWIYSKCMAIYLLSLLTLCSIAASIVDIHKVMEYGMPNHDMTWLYVFNYPWNFSKLLVLSICFLSLNRSAFTLSIKSFEWWFKFSQEFILNGIYIVEVIMMKDYWHNAELTIADAILHSITSIMVTQLFASADALSPKLMSSKFQKIALLLYAFGYASSVIVFNGRICSDPDLAEFFTIYIHGFGFSLWEIQKSAATNLSIFFGKQFILKIWRGRKEYIEATTLGYVPRIRWTRSAHGHDADMARNFAEIDTRTKRLSIEIRSQNLIG